jgi:hypothetical protein
MVLPMLRAAAINVDIDSLHLYYRIHGLDEAQATNAVWEKGVVRFAELFDDLDVKATFFVVSSDLERWPIAREIAQKLVAAGHELGSHSHTHPYDLVRLPDDAVARELERSFSLLSEVRGSPVAGFRAPGYTMTPRVLGHLRAAGYTYDSSIFPCPPYYLAKLAVLGAMVARGRKSQSIVGPPSVMWERRLPSMKDGLIELPVTVLPGVRFPVIGTSLLMLKQFGFRAIGPLLRQVPFVNLELHGIDLCDLTEDGIDPALLKQPDLRVPLAQKLALFREVFGLLRDDWGVDTLERLAPRLVAK